MGRWPSIVLHCELGVPEGVHQVSHFVLPFTSLMADLNGDVSTATTQFDHLTLHEGPKLSDDNPAVIIPDHLQVSNADYATSSAPLQDSASQSLQENRQFQNISPFSSFMVHTQPMPPYIFYLFLQTQLVFIISIP